MSNFVDTIRNDILEAIESDKLILPTLPEVALQVRDIAEAEDSSIMDLSGSSAMTPPCRPA